MEEHRIIIDYDEAYNLVYELNKILEKKGITLEIEDKEHDGYDVCIVKINPTV